MTSIVRATLLNALLCMGTATHAQECSLQGRLEGYSRDMGLELYIQPLGTQRLDTLRLTDGSYSCRTMLSADSLYTILGAGGNHRYQVQLPLYIDPKSPPAIVCEGQRLRAGGQENAALTAYTDSAATIARLLWERRQTATPDEMRTLAARYQTAAEALIARHPGPATAERYLRTWAYIEAATEGGAATPRRDLLDSPMGASFYKSVHLVAGNLPKGTLDLQLDSLYTHYTWQPLVRKTEELLLGRYIQRFDYTGHYQEGLETLTALTEKYRLDRKYLDDFTSRAATRKGMPFPDVMLTDAQGKPFDFASLRGTYVYIDLWASWCRPCIAEIPHLQQLERQLDGKVRFLSISIDTNERAWHNKREQLGLHGLQVICTDRRLSESLNIRGIPHFLVYDPDGRLYLYNAPRPSNPETLRLLQQLGKP